MNQTDTLFNKIRLSLLILLFTSASYCSSGQTLNGLLIERIGRSDKYFMPVLITDKAKDYTSYTIRYNPHYNVYILNEKEYKSLVSFVEKYTFQKKDSSRQGCTGMNLCFSVKVYTDDNIILWHNLNSREEVYAYFKSILKIPAIKNKKFKKMIRDRFLYDM